MKKRLFGHFGFVYSEIFSHASGMQNVSKLNHVYAKLQQFFVLNHRQSKETSESKESKESKEVSVDCLWLNTRLYEELSLVHFVSSRALYSKL